MIFIGILLSVFLIGISAISADDDGNIFTKDFTIGEENFTTPIGINNLKSNNLNASFTKEGYIFDMKKISDDDYNKYKKWIDNKKNDNNAPVEKFTQSGFINIYKTQDNNNTILFMLFKKNSDKYYAQIHGDASHNNLDTMGEILKDFTTENLLSHIQELGE